MREFCTSGSVRGAVSNGRPYREQRRPTACNRTNLPFVSLFRSRYYAKVPFGATVPRRIRIRGENNMAERLGFG
jgi:hypothetical protein